MSMNLFLTKKNLKLLNKWVNSQWSVADAAAKRKPHLICNYINDLATAFHSLYNAEKVINEENTEKTNEKLALIKALEITIKNALQLIGVTAPERM